MLKRIIDFLWPMCPSGMPHRARGEVVKNWLGKPYCWHPDCVRANFAECEVTSTPGPCIGNPCAPQGCWRVRCQLGNRCAELQGNAGVESRTKPTPHRPMADTTFGCAEHYYGGCPNCGQTTGRAPDGVEGRKP